MNSIPDRVFRQRRFIDPESPVIPDPLCLRCAEAGGATPARQGICAYCARQVYSDPTPRQRLSPTVSGVFYCSDAHERAHRSFLAEAISRMPCCDHCGTRFDPGNKNEKYCSSACCKNASKPVVPCIDNIDHIGTENSGLRLIPHPQGEEPRDFQRKRFYVWESNFHGTRDFDESLTHDQWLAWIENRKDAMDIESVVELVNRIFTDYGVQVPFVGSGQGRRSACFEAPSDYIVTTWDKRKVRNHRGIIKLPRWSRIVPVVLHECAHGLVMAHYNVSVAGHGPEFINQYLDLLVSYGGFDEHVVRQSASNAKLRF